METIGIYILKVTSVLTFFWIIYRICLHGETFYRFNRFFLLAGMALAVILPFIPLHYTVEVNLPLFAEAIQAQPSGPLVSTNRDIIYTSIYRLLPVLYIFGSCLLVLSRLSGLTRLFKIMRKDGYRRFPKYKLVETTHITSPFSFIQYIFIPKDLSDKEEGKYILKHEEAHISQYHWIDLLFGNILSILWWYNPMIWLYIKAIRENHEFLADHAVLDNWHQADYQAILVNHWLKVLVFPLTNSFSYSNQLKRIKMMKKNISNPAKKLISLLIIPGLAMFFMAFAEPLYTMAPDPLSQQDTIINSDDPFTMDKMKSKVVYVVNETIVNKGIGNLDPLEISSVTVLKDEYSLQMYGEEGVNGVVKITTKPEANIFVLDGKPVKPLFMVNGKKRETMAGINHFDISSIHILKNENAVQKYGDEGIDGVIEIITKE